MNHVYVEIFKLQLLGACRSNGQPQITKLLLVNSFYYNLQELHNTDIKSFSWLEAPLLVKITPSTMLAFTAHSQQQKSSSKHQNKHRLGKKQVVLRERKNVVLLIVVFSSFRGGKYATAFSSSTKVCHPNCIWCCSG